MPICPTCGGEHPLSECPRGETSWDAPTELGLRAVPQPVGAGLKVGEYRLVRRLGEGGMGVVWEGEHPLIGRKVAVKIVEDPSPHVAARFLKEAQAASRLRHRNIVDVFGFGSLPDGRSYLVMELLVGGTLADRIDSRGAMPFDEVLALSDGILVGLQVAHQAGIIHRDLKPENVWLAPPDDGSAMPVVKLLDFGLAKLTDPADLRDSLMTRAGVPLGTPAFMSPEQCRGVAAIDHRTDLYAVGVMLHLMLSGRLPFDGESLIDVMTRQLTVEPPSLRGLPGLPQGVDEVVRRALAKKPEERWASADELRAALHRCAPGLPGGTVAATRETEAPRPRVGHDFPTMIADGPLPLPVAAVPAAPREDDDPLARAVLIDQFTLATSLDDGALTVAMQGELDREDSADALAGHLLRIADAMADRVERVVLDLEGLYFLDGAALGCLGEWLGGLAAARAHGLAPTTIRYTTTVGWQKSAVPSLIRVDPAIRVEATDW